MHSLTQYATSRLYTQFKVLTLNLEFCLKSLVLQIKIRKKYFVLDMLRKEM